jgi:hypothetical protein
VLKRGYFQLPGSLPTTWLYSSVHSPTWIDPRSPFFRLRHEHHLREPYYQVLRTLLLGTRRRRLPTPRMNLKSWGILQVGKVKKWQLIIPSIRVHYAGQG